MRDSSAASCSPMAETPFRFRLVRPVAVSGGSSPAIRSRRLPLRGSSSVWQPIGSCDQERARHPLKSATSREEEGEEEEEEAEREEEDEEADEEAEEEEEAEEAEGAEGVEDGEDGANKIEAAEEDAEVDGDADREEDEDEDAPAPPCPPAST
jgi:hypothetical protein